MNSIFDSMVRGIGFWAQMKFRIAQPAGQDQEVPSSHILPGVLSTLLAVLVFALAGSPVRAGQIINIGSPTVAGTNVVTFKPPVGLPVTVSTPVTVGESIEDKIDAIVVNLTKAGYTASAVQGGVNVVVPAGSTMSDTGPAGDPGIQAVGTFTAGSMLMVGFSGDMTGQTAAGPGSVATYTASFSDASFSVSTTIAYNDLTTKTIDGLLTQTYQNLKSMLPVADKPNLTLDLPGGNLVYMFSGATTDPSVSGAMTDAGLLCTVCGPQAVPEPSTIVMLSIGGVVLIARARLSRGLGALASRF